jgi:hypothetical protein
MNRIIAGFAVTGCLLFIPPVLKGCGDTLVSLLSSVRYQRAYMASRHASIVVFSSQRATGSILTNPNLRATLKEVGHSVVIVQDSAQLDFVLRAGNVDVVLADTADAGNLSQELNSKPNKPVLVPVLYKPSKDEWAVAQKQFSFPLKASADQIQLLRMIEMAMKARAKP